MIQKIATADSTITGCHSNALNLKRKKKYLAFRRFTQVTKKFSDYCRYLKRYLETQQTKTNSKDFIIL